MTSTPTNEYKKITVTGDVSAHLLQRVETQQLPWTIIIMGPTGAGKSTFIESLGFNGAQKISSNRLDGFTQTVSTYKLNNVTVNGYPIYVIDSPGFADTKISELSIVTMLLKWMRDNNYAFSGILYFLPINQIRLAGSKRQVLKTFNALMGKDVADSITIVTTMWDGLNGESATEKAEETFRQLRRDIWKNLIKGGGKVVKFTNTQESALGVINQCIRKTRNNALNLEYMISRGQTIHNTDFAINLCGDLEDKIRNLEDEITMSQSSLLLATSRGDTLLESLYRDKLKEATEDLARFTRELKEFNSPSYGVPTWINLIKKLSRGRLEVRWGHDRQTKKFKYIIRRVQQDS